MWRPIGQRFRRFLCAGLALGMPEYSGAQWSASPVVAVGPAIPAGAFRDVAREGVAIKAGLWMRAPRVPIGVSVEAMLAQFGADATRGGLDGARVGALTVNATTRRHDRRLDTYGIAGAGWYWLGRTAPRYSDRQAPGFNLGVGEIVSLGDIDFFAELRVHAVRATSQTGSGWITFMPLLVGARF